MSEKNRDSKNRWRNVTIAFRMSPEEDAELDLRVKLCGPNSERHVKCSIGVTSA